MARGAARRVPSARSSAGPEAPERHPHARTRRHRATRTSTATSRNRPAGYGPSSGIRINTAKITLAGQAGLRDGQGSAMTRRKVGWRPGCQPDDLPKGYQLGFRGASLAPYGPAIMAGCPPEAELIGLRQEAPMFCQGVRGNVLVRADGQRLEPVHQPRCARLRRFRVDPPAPVHEAASTTRTGAD